jgi:hypothetical protein
MTRQKQVRKSHRFELDLGIANEKALHDFLVELSYQGKASAWIIAACHRSLGDKEDDDYREALQRGWRPAISAGPVSEPTVQAWTFETGKDKPNDQSDK